LSTQVILARADAALSICWRDGRERARQSVQAARAFNRALVYPELGVA